MIYIATHKKFENPNLENYIPLQVGAEGKVNLGYLTDNTGNNISDKNSNYCELTGLYWIWKNCTDEYKGLVHYRRFFGKNNYSNATKDIYSYQQLVEMTKDADIVLPFVETFKQNAKDELLLKCCTNDIFMKLEKIVKEKYPDYGKAFDEYFSNNRSSLFNMMFCKREIFDQYCNWLFDILFELEAIVDLNDLNDYQKRLYGFLSERLLNVWVDKNCLSIKHVPIINVGMSMVDRATLIRRRIGTKNILEYCSRHINTKVILMSTFEVYGEIKGKSLYTEDMSGAIDQNILRNGYPESKRCSELLLKSYVEEYKVQAVIARLPSVYGPTMLPGDSKAHAQFIRNAVNGENIILKSKGTVLSKFE